MEDVSHKIGLLQSDLSTPLVLLYYLTDGVADDRQVARVGHRPDTYDDTSLLAVTQLDDAPHTHVLPSLEFCEVVALIVRNSKLCILVIVYFSCAAEEKMMIRNRKTLQSEKVARKKCEDFLDGTGESARRFIRKINESRLLK